MNTLKKTFGFTLLELLICCSLILILSVISIASYSFLIRKNEHDIIVNDLKAAISYAKMQTIILGSDIILNPLNQESDWSKGIEIRYFNFKTMQLELINQWQWKHSQWNVQWRGVGSSNRIRFPRFPGNGISNGQFIVKNIHDSQTSTIILNRIGRFRVE